METPNALSIAREKINPIDDKLIALLAERFSIVMTEVMPAKIEAGKLLCDGAREAALLDRIRHQAAEKGLPEHVGTKIFRTILDAFLSEEIRVNNGGGDLLVCPDCGFAVSINDPKFNPRITSCPAHGLAMIPPRSNKTSAPI